MYPIAVYNYLHGAHDMVWDFRPKYEHKSKCDIKKANVFIPKQM